MMRIILFNFIVIIFAILLHSCSNIRESAGVTRKSADEFQAIKNPPLIIPPDFNLVAPNQLQQKKQLNKALSIKYVARMNGEARQRN